MNVYRVVSVRGIKVDDPRRAGILYLGRRNTLCGWKPHPLANPNVLPAQATKEQRAANLCEYLLWLLALQDVQEQLRRVEIETAEGETPLGCWCGDWSPGQPDLLCHAVVVAKLLNFRRHQRNHERG